MWSGPKNSNAANVQSAMAVEFVDPTLKEQLLAACPRRLILERGRGIALIWYRFRNRLKPNWGIHSLLLLLNNKDAPVDSEMEKFIYMGIARELDLTLTEMWQQVSAVELNEEAIIKWWEEVIYQEQKSLGIERIQVLLLECLAKNEFVKIAEALLELKLDVSQEAATLLEILYSNEVSRVFHSYFRRFGREYALGMFELTSDPAPLKGCEWLLSMHPERQPLNILCGHFFMAKYTFLCRMAYELRLARAHSFNVNAPDNLEACFKKVRNQCWANMPLDQVEKITAVVKIPEVILNTRISVKSLEILKDMLNSCQRQIKRDYITRLHAKINSVEIGVENLYTRLSLNDGELKYIVAILNANSQEGFSERLISNVDRDLAQYDLDEEIAELEEFTDVCCKTAYAYLERPLLFNDLSAIFSYFMLTQADLCYIEITTHANNSLEVEDAIKCAHSIVERQLKLTEAAPQFHPGVGHFFYGYAIYNVAKLLVKSYVALPNAYTFFLDNPRFKGLVLGEYFNGGDFDRLSIEYRLLTLALSYVTYADENRAKHNIVESNAFPSGDDELPDGLEGTPLIDQTYFPRTIKELLVTCQERLEEIEAAAPRVFFRPHSFGCKNTCSYMGRM